MDLYGDSAEFFEKRREKGIKTPLDNCPVLNNLQKELWEMYQFTSDNILVGLDIYSKRIGLPVDWSFKESAMLVSTLLTVKMDLLKAKRETKHA